jgi:hypothetical protein
MGTELTSGFFAIDQTGKVTVAAGPVPDGLYQLNITATGKDANNAQQTINQ